MIPLAESCFSIILTLAMIKAVRRVNIGHLGNMAVLVVAIIGEHVIGLQPVQNIGRFVVHALQLAILVVEVGRAGVLLATRVVTIIAAIVVHALQLAILVVEVGRAGVLRATRVVTIIAAIVVHAIHLAVLVVEADRAGVLLATLVVTCVAARVCTFQAHGRAM
jgi:hypothetical protein